MIAMGEAAHPMLYKIDKNPDWNVFLNMAQEANLTDKSGKERQSVKIHKNPSPTLHLVSTPAFFSSRTFTIHAAPQPRLRLGCWRRLCAAATRCRVSGYVLLGPTVDDDVGGKLPRENRRKGLGGIGVWVWIKIVRGGKGC